MLLICYCILLSNIYLFHNWMLANRRNIHHRRTLSRCFHDFGARYKTAVLTYLQLTTNNSAHNRIFTHMTNVTRALFVFCCLFKAPFTLHFDNFTTAATARKNLYPRIHYVTCPSRLLQAPQRSVPFPSHSRRFPVGRHSPCSPACVYRRAVLYGARGDVTRCY